MNLSMQKQLGANMLELIISVCIIGIVTAIAAPPFLSMIEANRVISTSNQIATSLYLARSTALNSKINVHICRKTETDECINSYPFNADWSNGWLVFSDNNSNANYDNQDTLISVIQKTGKTKIIFNQRGRLRYFPTGSSRSAGFYVCGASRKHVRHVRILRTGRVRITKTLTNRQLSKCG